LLVFHLLAVAVVVEALAVAEHPVMVWLAGQEAEHLTPQELAVLEF
jgi:hypothetical protein